MREKVNRYRHLLADCLAFDPFWALETIARRIIAWGWERAGRMREYRSREERLELLIETARESGLTIDFLEWITQGLSRQAFLRVMGNASSFPSNMKSSDSPNVRRSAKAPSSDSL